MKNQNLKKLNEIELKEIAGGGLVSWISRRLGIGTAPVNPVERVSPPSVPAGRVREAWYVPIRR